MRVWGTSAGGIITRSKEHDALEFLFFNTELHAVPQASAAYEPCQDNRRKGWVLMKCPIFGILLLPETLIKISLKMMISTDFIFKILCNQEN